MDTERSGLDEAMDVGSSTISHLKSLKTAATFSKAGYGAALGGPFSAAIGAVIANRNQFAKILLVILAILLLPVLFIVMLPGLIFGSLTEQSDVLNSNSMISENIRASREAIVEVLEESHEDILAEIHAAISRLPQGDTASINDPYTYSISVNANLLISQFCARIPPSMALRILNIPPIKVPFSIKLRGMKTGCCSSVLFMAAPPLVLPWKEFPELL